MEQFRNFFSLISKKYIVLVYIIYDLRWPKILPCFPIENNVVCFRKIKYYSIQCNLIVFHFTWITLRNNTNLGDSIKFKFHLK